MKLWKIGILSAVILMPIFFVVFGLLTAEGGRFIVKEVIARYARASDIKLSESTGNLVEGMTLQNLEIKDIKNLPEGTTLKIQKIFFNLTSLNVNKAHIEIENIRLKLPDSDPVIISGTFKEQQLDLNIFSNGFTDTEVLSYLPDFKMLVPIKGDVSDIDLFITGHYLEPIVKGNLTIEQFVYKGFLLTSAPISIDMQIKNIQGDIKLHGGVFLEEGELQTKRVLVKLDKGDLNFSGSWNEPRINLKGNAKVEKTKISIGLKGTIEKPELTLTSEPPYPRQRLMTMLATGKSWQSIEDSGDSGLNSGALTKDFIDYFFFAGKSNQFAKRFGISDFSVTFDQIRKSVTAKKELSEKLEVGYGIEQTKTNSPIADVSQKLEGEYRLSDKVSVGVEREMKKKQSDDAFEEQINENNDKVLLKYQKTF